ncbi:MAG TPA: hypothetical protein VMI75_11625 [Polyangiaceae bacterium]|nr:hypothetical protein [Polyangiaceae bacterium]
MRPLTFQVKLPAAGKTSLELSAAKSASLKGSSAAFGEVLHAGKAPAAQGGVDPRRPGVTPGRQHDHERREDPADPHVRHAAQLGPPPGLAQGEIGSSAAPPAPAGGPARTSLEDLLPALVRRVAWSGDGRRGTVRLELGSGSLAGAELVVHADDGHVRVHLRAPAGVDLGPLRERIAARLAARGVALDEVE